MQISKVIVEAKGRYFLCTEGSLGAQLLFGAVIDPDKIVKNSGGTVTELTKENVEELRKLAHKPDTPPAEEYDLFRSSAMERDIDNLIRCFDRSAYQPFTSGLIKGLEGVPENDPRVPAEQSVGFALGQRVQEALSYLYEVETELSETDSAVPNRMLVPDGDDSDSRELYERLINIDPDRIRERLFPTRSLEETRRLRRSPSRDFRPDYNPPPGTKYPPHPQ